MTETRIFELILKNNAEHSDFSFAKLDKQSVDVLSSQFTEVIYETLKQKSCNGTLRRNNILKFINNLCGVNEAHSHEESYCYYLNRVKLRYKKSEILGIVNDIKCDLNELNDNLGDEIIKYNENRNYKSGRKIIDYIKYKDQKIINNHFKKPLNLTKNASYYENLNAEMVKTILFEGENIKNTNKKLCHNIDYRKKQIKFAYSVINLKIQGFCDILINIFKELKFYTNLEGFEIDFLMYTFKNCDETKLLTFIIQHFLFVYEKLTIIMCKRILGCQNEQEISDFFVTLEKNTNFKLLQNLCMENIDLSFKIKSIVYELYCYSYCNENILRFCNLF